MRAQRQHPRAATIVPIAVIGGGAGLVILGTFVVHQITGTGGGLSSWVPSAAAAAGGWLALVLLAIAVWHVWMLVINVAAPPAALIPGMDDRVRRYLPPALLGIGILLGFFFFK